MTQQIVKEFPTYTVDSLKPKANDYCVCVFVLNEGERLLGQLKKSQGLLSKLDIIVADGGSNDHSVQQDKLQRLGVATLLTKTGDGKLSAQMRMAFDYALKMQYCGIIVMDGNGKDNPNDAMLIREALMQGADHVQGSRYVPGGKALNTPWLRHVAVKYIHAPLIALAAGWRYTDTTNGFRGYSIKFLTDPRVQPFRHIFKAYELHYYLAIRAARLNFKVVEVPVRREYPKVGKTPTKISPVKGNILIFKTLLSAVLGKYNPRVF